MSSVKTFLAFILTLLLFAVAPRLDKDSTNTGYYANSGAGFVIDHSSSGRFSRSGDPRLEVWVAPPDDSIQFNINLHYRREGQSEFAVLQMPRSPEALDRYSTPLPRLGRGEYYEYYFELSTTDGGVTLRLPRQANSQIALLFEGSPTLVVWGAHVGIMFIAAMYGFLALFNSSGLRSNEKNLKKLSRKVFITGALMLLGTALIGTFVSHIRFGYYWGGWPFDDNRSQTYMELLIFYWLGLTVLFRGTIFGFKPEKNFVSVPGAIVLTLVGVLFMIIVYLAGGHFVDIPNMIKFVDAIDGWLAKLTKGKCEYADLRVQQIEVERLSTSSQKVEPVEKSVSLGFSVRVLKNGSWGFAASSQFNDKEYERIVKLAIAIAEASRKVNKLPIELGGIPANIGSYTTPVMKDPFLLPIKEKLDLLAHWEELMRKNPAISSTTAFMDFRRETKMFRSSSGSDIQQVLLHTGAGVTCGIVKSRRERYERSFPTSSGQFVSGGFEKIASFKIEENAEKIASQAIEMQTAVDCPEKVTDLVLSPDLASLQIHESIGHPLELDRVFGSERNFSGTSFATVDQLNKLRYASDKVNVYSDPTYPGGLATYKYDDDGVAASRAALIEKGMLVGYLSSLETAKRIGMASSAASRAEGWGNVPLVRMTNLLLEPGDKKFADMIAEVEDGIYIEGVESWSIDDNRDNFTLGGEVGWEIKNGKLGAMIKSPSYSGNTVQFWNSCDSTGHKDEWVLWGTPNCGKGEPGQNARTAQGAAYVRFRQVKVGE